MSLRTFSCLSLFILGLLPSYIHAQEVLDHEQERIARVQAISLFTDMSILGQMNNGTRPFTKLFESENTTELPNDFPPVCDQIPNNSRKQYGEPMIVLDYANTMEKINANVEYALVDLGNLQLGETDGTIEVTFEKHVELKKKCGENSFPTGMRVKQIAVIHFATQNGEVVQDSFRIQEIRQSGAAQPTSNGYILEKGTNGNMYPASNVELDFNNNTTAKTNFRGVLPDNVRLVPAEFAPDHFWQHLTSSGTGKTKAQIDEIKTCNCQGLPYILFEKNNRLDLGILVGTPNGSMKNGWLNAEILGIETGTTNLSLSWTHYFKRSNPRLRPLFALALDYASEEWKVSSSEAYYTQFGDVDPDGDSYIRNMVIEDIDETLAISHAGLHLEAGYAYAPEIPGLLVDIRGGLDYAHALKSQYQSSAEGAYSGKYPQLFGVVLAENGIYDFGTYDLVGQGQSILGEHGIGGHFSIGMSYRPNNQSFGVAMSGQYSWLQWQTAGTVDYISRSPEELSSTFSLSSGVARSLFAFYPRIFLQF